LSRMKPCPFSHARRADNPPRLRPAHPPLRVPMRNKQHPMYRAWAAMRQRCSNPNCASWPYYGGRGISMCERWRSFANFLADMGERPKGMSIDRINNDGNYEPGNCRWATQAQQNSNKRQLPRKPRNPSLPRKIKDIAGQRFGRLVAVVCVGADKKHLSVWECACDCGGKTAVVVSQLTRGRTKSCGCLHREASIRNIGIAHASNACAKLSADDVREIKASSDSTAVLTRRFGVSHNTIWRVRTAQSWKGVF
jgi:hypothetical protein